MAGYERAPKLYTLKFEDHPGFEVTMKGLSIDGFLQLTRLAGKFAGVRLQALTGADLEEALAVIETLFIKFAKSLRQWNLIEQGEPVPATVEGVRSQDFDFILEITLAWMDAIASVDTPLPPPASSPGSSQDLSLPMEPLSPSLPS